MEKKITVSRKKAKKLTVSRKKAKILTVNRKSHYPIETLLIGNIQQIITNNWKSNFCALRIQEYSGIKIIFLQAVPEFTCVFCSI